MNPSMPFQSAWNTAFAPVPQQANMAQQDQGGQMVATLVRDVPGTRHAHTADNASYTSFMQKQYMQPSQQPPAQRTATPPAQVVQQFQQMSIVPQTQSAVQNAPNAFQNTVNTPSRYGSMFNAHRESPPGLFQNASITAAQNANASQFAASQQQLPQTPSAGAQHYPVLLQRLQQDAVQAMKQPYAVTVLSLPGQTAQISR